MNIEKHLILVKGEDKTEAISRCEYVNGKWQVEFAHGKTYAYSFPNVQWLKNPKLLDPSITAAYHENQHLLRVENIIVFDGYVRICFASGYQKVYRKQEITLEQSCLHNRTARNSFEYLRQLAAKVSVTNEEDSCFLSKQYAGITYVSPSSVLAKYLHPAPLNKPERR